MHVRRIRHAHRSGHQDQHQGPGPDGDQHPGRPGGQAHGPARPVLLAIACAGLLALAACDDNGSGDGAEGTGNGGFLGLGGDPEPDPVAAEPAAPAQEAVVVAGESADALAVGTSSTLFTSAPVVVLASADEQLRAASAGLALGVPVLVDGPATGDEIDRLGSEVALVLGAVNDPGIDVVVPEDDAQLADLLGIDADAVTVSADDAADRIGELDPDQPQLLVPAQGEGAGGDSEGEGAGDGGEGDDGSGADEADGVATATPDPGAGQDGTEDTGTAGAQTGREAEGATGTPDDAGTAAAPEPLNSDRDELPPTARPEPLESVLLMSTGEPQDLAALATARAAGAQLLVGPHTDPRATSETVQALAETDPATLVGLGDAFGDDEALTWKARTARTGVELPGGGQLALPGKTYVALYGTPSTGALGVLGEQPIEQTITRAEEHAGWYEPLTEETVIPTLEIIATIASAAPEHDNSYSNELPVSELGPLIDLAAEHGQYVVLDLQPGRHDFLSQAQRYEELLVLPHVGLALDPEWRLRPDQVHLRQIGQVSVDEVNEVVEWLADLTREHELPQKVLVLHMFQNRMIPDVDGVDLSRDELAVLIHADGQGAQPDKQTTWRTLQGHAPSVEYWGWKNFYDEDVPMLTPEQTMSEVDPLPDFISYQ